jgi:hypothetical protein
VVAGAEAFLRGTSARHLRRRRNDVPGWAWLNALAHGDTFRIFEIASGCGPNRSWHAETRRWRQALVFIASQMVESSGGTPSSLGQIQMDVLQPLEERMMRDDPGAPRTPEQLVAAALSAMWPNPRSQRQD